MVDIQEISTEVAIALAENYNQRLQAASDSENIIDLFTIQPEVPANPIELLYGFRLSVNDYVNLLSHIGITNWKFTFGYDPTSENGKAHFKLLLQGSNERQSLRTRHFLLEKQITTPPNIGLHEPNPKSSKVVQNVPHFLLYNWTNAWSNLLNAGEVKAVFSKVNVHNGFAEVTLPLLGYTYNYSDLVGCLNSPSLGATSEVRIYFVNHWRIASEQNNEPGTFGLLMAAYRESEDSGHQNVTAFFDFSKPCPPTC